jgi:hypothetical protein
MGEEEVVAVVALSTQIARARMPPVTLRVCLLVPGKGGDGAVSEGDSGGITESR